MNWIELDPGTIVIKTAPRKTSRTRFGVSHAALLLSVVLAGCSGTGFLERQAILSEPPRQRTAEPQTPAQREHARILAAYGGAYENPKLQPLIDDVVTKLVASSERPDLKYKVTILNSPAINAFALPTGQLYITRGLIALANDTSELASVLSHEMAHVIASHAAIREDQVRQAALVSRVASDVLGDPQTGALALAKSKIAIASFSRAQEFEADGIGVGISSRAGFDPYGATRFLTSMGRNAELKAATAKIDPHSLDFLSSHPATPERVRNAQLNARQYVAPGPGNRDKDGYLEGLDGLIFGEDPSEGFVRGRKFLHPKLGFTFTAPEGYALDNTAQAVFGVKDGGEQALAARRGAGAGRPEIAGISALRLDREYRCAKRRGGRRQRLQGRDRDRQGRPMVVPALCRAVRQRSLPLHLCCEVADPRNSTAPRAIRSAASGACRAPKPMPPGRCGCAA